MQKIVPNIWCRRNAEEAAAWYAETFDDASWEVEARYPASGLLDFQREFAGEPLAIGLSIAGMRFTLINAGDEFSPTPAISFMLNFDPLVYASDEELARAALQQLWDRLRIGGRVLIELGATDFSPLYGWVEDRFGVSWQLILTDPAGEPRPFIMPCLLFAPTAGAGAAAAVDHYLAVFEDASLGVRVPVPDPAAHARPDAVLFSDFMLCGQWFVAMDAPEVQAASFTCGVSLEVRCIDQAEIDRLWEALSAVPEAEQCGWLEDGFGVSWQIVPRYMGELMRRPGAFEHMLGMKKLVIEEI